MEPSPLQLKDKKIFDKYLKLKNHELSNYTFTNIFIWKKLFKIYWQIIDKNLCIFFQDHFGYFMYLPPLGKNTTPKTIETCFGIMHKLNKNKNVSRIENIEDNNIKTYQYLNYKIFLKCKEYICKTDDLIKLQGNKFKSKRSSYNFFIKNYKYKFLKYVNSRKEGVLNLHKCWQENRRKSNPNNIYQGLLEDSKISLEKTLKYFKDLNLQGYIIKINNRIEGFTCGFPINPKMFCILFEVTNLEKKGLSSFVFREFAKILKNYKELNIMDDSGLLNLRKTKLFWKPNREISSYVATEN